MKKKFFLLIFFYIIFDLYIYYLSFSGHIQLFIISNTSGSFTLFKHSGLMPYNFLIN